MKTFDKNQSRSFAIFIESDSFCFKFNKIAIFYISISKCNKAPRKLKFQLAQEF